MRKKNIFSLSSYILLVLVMLSFATDVRFALPLPVARNLGVDLQLFEFFAFPLFIVLLFYFLSGQGKLIKQDFIFLLFVIWAAMIAVADGPNFYHSISRVKDFFLAWVLFYVARELYIVYIYRLMILSALLGVLFSIIGLMQILGVDIWFGSGIGALFSAENTWKTVVNPFTGNVWDAGFSQGLYRYPQNFIYYLILPLCFLAWMTTIRNLFVLPLIIVFLAMIGSGSKTFLILFTMGSVWLVFRKLFRFAYLPSMTGMLLSLFTLLALSAVIIPMDYLVKSGGTFIWRLEQWSDTFRMLIDVPVILITGHGTVYLEHIYSRFNYPNPHNAVLYFLMEYGVVGLVLFVLFLYSNLRYKDLRLSMLDSPGVHYQDTKSNCRCGSHRHNYNYASLLGARNINSHGLLHFCGSKKFIYYGLAFTLVMTIVDDYFVQTQLTAIFFFYLGGLVNLRGYCKTFLIHT